MADYRVRTWIMVGGLLLGLLPGPGPGVQAAEGVKAAEPVLEIQPQSLARWLTLDGRVEPVHQGTVASQTSGRVVRMLVDVNDQVAAGATLLEISGNEQSSAVSAASARLARAKAQQQEADRQLKRAQPLAAKGVIARAQLDNAVANAKATVAEVQAAEADLAQAREAYGYTRVLAPYSGVVTARLVELGETVAPGTPLLSGLSLDALRVVAELPQSAVGSSPLTAQQIEVILPSGKLVSPVKVLRFNYADPASHTFTLRLDLPDGMSDLLPGVWVKVRIRQGERQVLLIPQRALLRQGELSAVYVQGKEGWLLTPVLVGAVQDVVDEKAAQQVEILSGLSAGDKIAADAWSLVQEVGHE